MRVFSISIWCVVTVPAALVTFLAIRMPSAAALVPALSIIAAPSAATVCLAVMLPLLAVYNTRHAHRQRRPRAHLPALREPELSGVVRLLRGELVRGAPRTRVQRDPQRLGADRRLAAVQVPAERTRRGEARRSRHHPRRLQARRRTGVLHPVVRRARQGD